MLLLAAATAGDGFGYSSPGVHLKKWLRPHTVVAGDPPPGGPQYTAANMAGGNGPGGGPASGRRFMNTRSQVYFLDPNGMKIGWQSGTGPNGERLYLGSQLTVPARYNFNQGFIYRLKITDIQGRPGVTLYPTVEVAPTTPITDAYLAHNAIPVQFTPEDFDQVVDGGNFVTKVIYLPDPKYQELAVSAETLVSTRLEPGIDPILEADKRGTILLIVRVGAIDLEMPGASGAPGVMGAPVGGGMMGAPVDGVPINTLPGVSGAPIGVPASAPVTELPPGTLPPGAISNVPPTNSVPLDATPPAPAPGLDAATTELAPVNPKPAAPAPKPAVPPAPKPSALLPK